MSEVLVERKDKMRSVAIETIEVKDRARIDFGEMDEFVASIKSKGVIQPITLDENLVLQAGGRRLEGAKRAGLTKIPAIIRPFVDILDSREIELMENIYRKDFTWQEKCKLIKEIDDLQKAKDPNWSLRKTADLIDKSVGGVSMSIQLAEYLEAVPELANLKTADDAYKFVKKIEEDLVTEELRKRQTASMQAPAHTSKEDAIKKTLHRADANYTIADCFEGMAELRSNGMIHFIECDPPFGIDLNQMREGKKDVVSTIDGYEEIPAEQYDNFLDKLTNELFRVANRDCWMIFWYANAWQSQVFNSLQKAGWHVDEVPAIWVKTTGQTQQPEILLARSYEQFYVCRKGKPILNKRGRNNTFFFSGCATLGADAKYHPTQRPIPLIEELLETFTVGQQVVMVPFLGSGATLRACYNRGLLCFGYDKNPQYKDKFMLAVEQDSKRLLAT